MTFEELQKRANTEGFNPELFYKYGVAIECDKEINQLYSGVITKVDNPNRVPRAHSPVELDSWEIAKNSLILDRMIKAEEFRQRKDRTQFDELTREKIRRELEKII